MDPKLVLAVFLAAALSIPQSRAQDDQRTQKLVDTMVRLCLAGGHSEVKSGGVKSGVDFSIRSFDAKGNLSADYRVDSSNAEGLVNGINNALTQVAADQADKVRDCLKPLRERLLDAMMPNGEASPAGGSTQITNGAHSPAINNVHGNVTITEGK